MGIVCPQVVYVSTGDGRVGKADFTDELISGIVITGTPTVSEVGTTHLTITSVKASTEALTILGRSVTAGQALIWHATGFVVGTTYTLRGAITTDGSPSETMSRDFTFVCQ